MAELKVETSDALGELVVDAAVAVCNGDVRAALRAALVANAFLESELERLAATVSFGFTRGKSLVRRASEKLDDWREISAGDPPKEK